MEIHAEICRRHQVEPQSSLVLQSAWAHAQLGDRKVGIAELRRAIAASSEKNERISMPRFQALLAELEAEEEDFEGALARIDEALALARETGLHLGDAFVQRLRGEIYLKRDPGECRACRGGLPDRSSPSPNSRAHAALRPARGAVAGEALPIDRPPRRGARCPRARARRLFADAGNAADRRGDVAISAVGLVLLLGRVLPFPRTLSEGQESAQLSVQGRALLRPLHVVSGRPLRANTGHSTSGQRTPQIDRGRVKT